MVRAGAAVLSLGAFSVLAASPVAAHAAKRKGAAATAADVDILNVALGLEHEAIEAYQIGAESGLLQKPALDVAVSFQSHHKAHRDALVATIGKLGGQAVEAKPRAEYVSALNVAAIKSQADILKLAARLERGAANAYLGVIPSFNDKALAQVSARLAADETMHWTALASALGEPLPTAALSFGA
jgi:rubrerythrin